MSLLGPLFAIAFIADAYARCSISLQGIRKMVPIRGVMWEVRAAEIHDIVLQFANAWRLKVRTTGDRSVTVPLSGSLRAALASLYPEIGTGESRPLPKRWGYALYALLAIVLAATAILSWVLSKRGFVSWK